jgi:hypothetical protein
MTEIEKLQQKADRRRAEIVADAVLADEDQQEEMRAAEEERAERIEEAAAKGITLHEPHADPAANHAVALTSSPTLSQTPAPEQEPAQTQMQTPLPPTRRAHV